MSKYMEDKKIHMRTSMTATDLKAACGIHNKTYAFKSCNLWKCVTCKRCLKFKPKAGR